jgi:hypothetical protein
VLKKVTSDIAANINPEKKDQFLKNILNGELKSYKDQDIIRKVNQADYFSNEDGFGCQNSERLRKKL